MTLLRWSTAVAAALVGAGACYSAEQPAPVTCEPTLASIRASIFVPRCAGSGCHGSTNPARLLDLTDPARDLTVERGSANCQGWSLVVPGHPEQSLLWAAVYTDPAHPPCGDATAPEISPMPKGAPLTAVELACIRDWIASEPPCETCGGAGCVDLLHDTANCGTCGLTCPAGIACEPVETATPGELVGRCSCPEGTSACGGQCVPGLLTECGGACVDTQGNSEHCGGCGRACPAGAPCVAGSCDCGGLTACGGACVDVTRSVQHCGACDAPCGPGEACAGGTCVCPGTLTACTGGCVDTNANALHCGGCDQACPGGEVCLGGVCAAGCGTLTECGGGCVDTSTDELHCGTCSNACAVGQTCTGTPPACACPGTAEVCGGQCTDTGADPANCGGCGATDPRFVCANGQVCQGGACVCPGGGSPCPGGCVDLASDVGNCGGCAVACGPGQTCNGGTCTCGGGGTPCPTGCVDTASDEANCGACGQRCGVGQSCVAGSCTCGTTTVSLSRDVQPILSGACTDRGCHGTLAPTGKTSLRLSSASQTFTTTVGKASDAAGCTTRIRVQPGDPAQSYLLDKLTNQPDICGGQMPKTGVSLTPAQLGLIGGWICQGAPNN